MCHKYKFKITYHIYEAQRSRVAGFVSFKAPTYVPFSWLRFSSLHSRNLWHRELVYHYSVRKKIIPILENRNELEGCAYYGKIEPPSVCPA